MLDRLLIDQKLEVRRLVGVVAPGVELAGTVETVGTALVDLWVKFESGGLAFESAAEWQKVRRRESSSRLASRKPTSEAGSAEADCDEDGVTCC